MCLDTIDSPAQRKKYLAKKPKVITAYKTVAYYGQTRPPEEKVLEPYFFIGVFYRGSNTSNTHFRLEWAAGGYVPHFHCWITKKAAKRDIRIPDGTRRTIKITIAKKDITATGWQGGYRCIVTKKFHIDPKVYDKAIGG